MVVLFLFLLLYAVALMIVFLIRHAHDKERENQLIQSYMQSLQSFYQMIQKQIQLTRCYRHDLAKHIQTLDMLLQEDETQEIQEYMENLVLRYRQLKSGEYCSDELINTVVSIKKQQCEEKSIPFEAVIEDTDYQRIRDIDMVAILYNLLDNAFEASERVEENAERGIRLQMGAQEGKIWIRVENRITPGHPIVFETSKSDKEMHGVGMTIIDYVTSQYHGKRSLQIDVKRGLFITDIRMGKAEKGGAGTC